jgi:hypothetical protein
LTFSEKLSNQARWEDITRAAAFKNRTSFDYPANKLLMHFPVHLGMQPRLLSNQSDVHDC